MAVVTLILHTREERGEEESVVVWAMVSVASNMSMVTSFLIRYTTRRKRIMVKT